MILRKPYAILIKNFKLIHTLITICMIYLVYRSYLLFDFVRTYMNTNMLAAERDLTNELFNLQMFILPGIIIVLLIILLAVMIRKKKPKLFYIANIFFYGLTIGIYTYVYGRINYLETNIMELREIKLVHDILLILLAVQILSMIFSFIRAAGLDLKKFDFGKDLLELDVQDADNEEFEVSVNVETNVIKRSINKRKRFFRYVYVENKFLLNTLFLIAIATISFLLYMNMNIYNVVFNEGETFSTNEYILGVQSSFLTQKDYRGNIITDNDKYLLILKLNINAFNNDSYFNTAKAELSIDGKDYFPSKVEYKNLLFDLGNVYYNEEITKDVYKNYLLVYEIPISKINSNMQFKYINDIEITKNTINPKYIRVNLNPIKIDENIEEEIIEEGKDIILNDVTLGETKMVINSSDIAKYFTLNYKFCLTSEECYSSVEYVRPTLNENYDEALIKLNSQLTLDENITISNIYTPYNIINYFGSINYTVDNVKYTYTNGFSNVLTYRVSSGNNYYIEINDNILNADTANIIITIRNKKYTYQLK